MLGDVALIFKTSNETQAVVATPQIPELQRQEDLCELKASLVYISLCCGTLSQNTKLHVQGLFQPAT